MLYLFKCKKTNKVFEYECPIGKAKEYLEQKKIKCPCCNETKVVRIFTSPALHGLPTRGKV